MSKERIVIVCPGRGTYNQSEWGYLQRHHQNLNWLSTFDRYRSDQGQPGIQELDQTLPYQLKVHSRGDNASPLIYACALADALALDRERFEVVAVTGNSMGWYIALAVANALSAMDTLHLINSMGTLMHQSLVGGQLIYPWVDDDWQPQWHQRERLLAQAQDIHLQDGAELYLSIDLGGMLVFGGNESGLRQLSEKLPPLDRFPMRLFNHAAFHTPLQQAVQLQARQRLNDLPFSAPEVPLVDGRGHIWTPWSTDPDALWDYTLGEQLTHTYDFTRAIQVAAKEFAPDRIVITGPGTTLGGAVAQSLIQGNWQNLAGKKAFQLRQEKDPIVVSMGMDTQRHWVMG